MKVQRKQSTNRRSIKEKSPTLADWAKLVIPAKSVKTNTNPQEILRQLRYGSLSR